MLKYFLYSTKKLPNDISLAFGGRSALLGDNAGAFISGYPLKEVWEKVREKLCPAQNDSVCLLCLGEKTEYAFCGDPSAARVLAGETSF